MAGDHQRWIVGGFILIVIFVGAFLGVSLLLPRGIGMPETFQIDPAEITLAPGQGRQFRAVHEGKVVHGVEWTVTGGVIGPEGFYTAPDAPGDYQVSAHHPYTGYSVGAIVHVTRDAAGMTPDPPVPTSPVVSTETPSFPTLASLPPTATAPSATPTSVQVPTLSPAPAMPLDGGDDLVSFDTLEPVTGSPPGSDIRSACFDEEGRLVQAVPPELATEIGDWNTEGYLILWITLHEPIPEPLDVERYWLFALDTDGDAATGRPRGDGLVNPDIGPEVTIGVHSNPVAGVEFNPYAFVWNAQAGSSEQRAVGLEARFSMTRNAVFIRVPVEILASTVRALSRTEPAWDRTVGRAAATVGTSAARAIDFFPERP